MTRKKITPATTVEQRLARPRETPEQRNARRLAQAKATIAKATIAKMRAEFDVIAARAEAAGMNRRQVMAIRAAAAVHEMVDPVDPSDSLEAWALVVSGIVGAQEAMIRRGQVSMGEIAEEPAA